ncbi:MAG: hypothetical protein ABS34_02915 [Opitutaceae bacterium BACL24 MAG-120322-bin51]|jgi:hypothetical protein|nr:MAG: hypothetical protein ABS34_02915 [Opitutaceae bacterium BACL24 MAG-120322-bin51]
MIRHCALKELNLILHEAPGEDGDWGWFSREHAVIVDAVLQMLGHPTVVMDGLLIMQDGTHTLATIPLGHAWNMIYEDRLFDASVTTHHMTSHFKEFSSVDTKRPDNCPYPIHYTEKLPDTIAKPDRPAGLYYYRKESFSFNAALLLEDPYQFIHKPEPGTPDLLESYGRDIFFKLAYHIYLLHQGQAKPLSTGSDDLLDAVATSRSGARKKVLAILDGSAGV